MPQPGTEVDTQQQAGPDWGKAWGVLGSTGYAVDKEELEGVLETLFVRDKDDLAYLDKEQLQQLADLLKPGMPRKKFLASVFG